jgi:hypothetical protein
MRLAIPGIIELVVAVLHPDEEAAGGLDGEAAVGLAVHGIPWGATWAVGVMAISSSGTAATQPPKAAESGTRNKTARRALEKRSVAGMWWDPSGLALGPP